MGATRLAVETGAKARYNFNDMEPPEPHRKRNKKYYISDHAHFLTFSATARFTSSPYESGRNASQRKKEILQFAPRKFSDGGFLENEKWTVEA